MKKAMVAAVSIAVLALFIFIGVNGANKSKDYAIAVNGSGQTFSAKIRFDGKDWAEMADDERAVLLNDIVVMVAEHGGKEPFEVTAIDSKTGKVIFSHNTKEGLVEFER